MTTSVPISTFPDGPGTSKMAIFTIPANFEKFQIHLVFKGHHQKEACSASVELFLNDQAIYQKSDKNFTDFNLGHEAFEFTGFAPSTTVTVRAKFRTDNVLNDDRYRADLAVIIHP